MAAAGRVRAARPATRPRPVRHPAGPAGHLRPTAPMTRSAGVLLLIALLAAQRRPVLGGALLAVAVAFKPYALAWLLPLLAYGGVAWPLLAFVVDERGRLGLGRHRMGTGPILDSLRRADGAPSTGLLLAGVGGRGPPADARGRWGVVRYVAGALTALARLDVGPHGTLVRGRGHRGVPCHPVHRLVVHVRVPGRDRAHRVLASGRLARPGPPAHPLAGRSGRVPARQVDRTLAVLRLVRASSLGRRCADDATGRPPVRRTHRSGSHRRSTAAGSRPYSGIQLRIGKR